MDNCYNSKNSFNVVHFPLTTHKITHISSEGEKKTDEYATATTSLHHSVGVGEPRRGPKVNEVGDRCKVDVSAALTGV